MPYSNGGKIDRKHLYEQQQTTNNNKNNKNSNTYLGILASGLRRESTPLRRSVAASTLYTSERRAMGPREGRRAYNTAGYRGEGGVEGVMGVC